MATQPASGNQVAGGRESASDDWDASGKTAPGMENLIGDGNQEAAEEVTEEAEAEPAQEEAEAEVAEEAPAEEAAEEEQEAEPLQEEVDYNAQIKDLSGKLSQKDQLLSFYEKQVNDLTQKVNQLVATAQQKGAERAAPQAQVVPPQQLEPPPETWESTKDLVTYFDKRNAALTDHVVQGALQRAYQQVMQPALERINSAIHSVVEEAVKPNAKDFDKVLGDVTKQVFVLDSTGQKIVGVANQQLLNYFRAQPIPVLAMYKWGLANQAPTIIKKASNEAVSKAVKKLATRPKAPATVKGKEKPKTSVPELDWDTPRDVAEGILAKRRLI